MRRIFWLVLLGAAMCHAAPAQTPSIDAMRRMFDYDKDGQLDIKEAGVINRNVIS